MTGALPSHADWYTGSRLAPYLREMRMAGGAATLLEAAQPAGDMSNPPTADLVLVRTVSAAIRHRSDLGAGRFVANSPAGSLFLIPPATATMVEVHQPHVVRGLALPAARLRPQLEAARPGADPFDFGWLHAAGFQDPHILALLDRLWEEAARDDAASLLYAEGATVALLGALLRLAGQPDRVPRGGLAAWQLRRVQEHIEERLDEDIGLAELAALVGLSPWHLCRAFRRSTGLPPHRWQIARRIERARALLEETDQPIGAIAAAVGHEDPGRFAAVFRKATGLSPTAWRRARQG